MALLSARFSLRTHLVLLVAGAQLPPLALALGLLLYRPAPLAPWLLALVEAALLAGAIALAAQRPGGDA